MDPVIGLELGGFIVTRALKSGGMGVVYEARHPIIGHRVAVKVLRPEHSANREASARLLREAQSLSAVKHPNVVEIVNFGRLPSGAEYLTMELVEGETLSELIAREAPMPPLRALRICEEIAAGLAAAHAAGVVHRDLKPGNIVLMEQASEEPLVKVLDFGLARKIDTDGEPTMLDGLGREGRASILAGTPEYISPEQASGRPVDGRGDLYALGVILYELLTGRLPFESESGWELLQLHRASLPPLVSALIPDAWPPLVAFVDQLLKKRPAERPSCARAARGLMQQLAGEIHDLPINPTPLVGPLVRAVNLAPPRRVSPLIWLGAAMMLAASGTAPSTLPPPVVEQRSPAEPSPVAFEPAPILVQPAVAPEPVVVAAAAVVRTPVRKVRRKARARAAATVIAPATPVKPACEVSEAWRQQLHRQLEHLEQRSLALIPDSAPPSAVADVKKKSRGLAEAVSAATDSGCADVEAQLSAWREATP